ncbi:MAG: sulfatase-like hydrolase/transferase, partial [Planctomycetota bacterium]
MRALLMLASSLLLAGCAAGGESAENAISSKPNLVLIVADDLGYADVGFNGLEQFPTPHIDRIANEGVRFTQGYVTHAVCGPSRAGMITGRYQDRFGSSINPTVNPAVPNGVPRTERTLAELLRAAGYESMAVGKWH